MWLRDDGLGTEGVEGARRQNLSAKAQRYLDRLGASVEDLFHHVLATLHDPAYRKASAGAHRMDMAAHPLSGLDGWRGRRRGGGPRNVSRTRPIA